MDVILGSSDRQNFVQTDKDVQTDKVQTDKVQTDKVQTDKVQTDKVCSDRQSSDRQRHEAWLKIGFACI